MYDLLEFNIRVATIAHLNPALEFYFAKKPFVTIILPYLYYCRFLLL